MWKKHRIETTRGPFEYFRKGTGEPLCITHLYSEFNQNGNTFAAPFTGHFSVYLVNLRGCGASQKAEHTSDFSMAAAVEDLEAVREALGFAKWAFGGHSSGGMLALAYAVKKPGSLTKIIAGGLCASAAYMHHPGSIYCKDHAGNRRILEIFSLLDKPETTIDERRALNREWTAMSLYEPGRYDELMSRPNSGKIVSGRLNYFSYTELKSFDLRPELPHVTLPAYLYCGLHDTQCPHLFTKEACDLMPGASLTTFMYSNHYPFVEEEEAFLAFAASVKNGSAGGRESNDEKTAMERK